MLARAAGTALPILIVTARDAVEDRLQGSMPEPTGLMPRTSLMMRAVVGRSNSCGERKQSAVVPWASLTTSTVLTGDKKTANPRQIASAP